METTENNQKVATLEPRMKKKVFEFRSLNLCIETENNQCYVLDEFN